MAEQTAGEPTAAFKADRPVDLKDRDLFGHSDYARVLADSVLDTDTDFTFGLFGDWGLGKTTVIRAMIGLLENKKARCAAVIFDAWRYQDDSFRREFLREVAGELVTLKAFRHWDPKDHLGQLDEDRARTDDKGVKWSWPEFLRSSVILGILAIVLFAVVGGVVFSAAAGTVIALVALMPVLGFALVRLERVLKVQQETVTRKRLEDPDRFAALFRAMVGHINRRVLVVAIDNLDRLPASEAVSVLATIKTFLEPEAEAARLPVAKQMAGVVDLPETRVVFVVAIDDGALRRHLQTLAPNPEADAAGARRHADEYLRKFFNASITLRPLLSGDLSEYIRDELTPVFERARTTHRTDGEIDLDVQLQQTVDMAVVALRRNPRRVRQFVGNLELQLRLMRERETSRGKDKALIDRPISGHVALVAKLELLGAEWPLAFEELRKDETRWDAWHDAAQRGDRPTELDQEEWLSLAPVLRTSRRIDAAVLRPLLRVKRARDEVHILDFDEFRASVVGGDHARLLRYELALADRGEAMPAEVLPRIFSEELRAERFENAMNVVEALLAFFADDVDVGGRTLSDALADARIAERLGSLDPDRLMEIAQGLPAPERARVLEMLAKSLTANDALHERRQRVVAQLVQHVEQLDATGREAIRTALADDAIVAEFELYAPLADADPKLLPARACGDASLGWLQRMYPGDLRSLLATRTQVGRRDAIRGAIARHAPLKILLVAARNGAFAGREADLLAAITSLLETMADEHYVVPAVAEFGAAVVGGIDELDSSSLERFVELLAAHLGTPGIAVGERLRVLHACGQLLDLAPGLRVDGRDLVQAAALSDETLAHHVSAHSHDLPVSLRPGVIAQLGGAEQDSAESPITRALEALDRTLLARAASSAPEKLGFALDEWIRRDGAVRMERLRMFAGLAAGPHLSGRALAGSVRVSALRVENVLPEDPRGVDPGAYLGRVVLGMARGDETPIVVTFRGRLTLTLARRENQADVAAVVHDLEWAGDVS